MACSASRHNCAVADATTDGGVAATTDDVVGAKAGVTHARRMSWRRRCRRASRRGAHAPPAGRAYSSLSGAAWHPPRCPLAPPARAHRAVLLPNARPATHEPNGHAPRATRARRCLRCTDALATTTATVAIDAHGATPRRRRAQAAAPRWRVGRRPRARRRALAPTKRGRGAWDVEARMPEAFAGSYRRCVSVTLLVPVGWRVQVVAPKSRTR